MHPTVRSVLRQAEAGLPLAAAEAEALAMLVDSDFLDILALGRIAASAGGAAPFTCGIVNAKSGLCQENCAFCAQSAHHTAAPPVHGLLDRNDLLARAEKLAEAGADYMGIVCSGTRPDDRDFRKICALGEEIRARHGLKPCASLGLLSPEQARELVASGFVSYHHNLETAASYYPRICSSHPYSQRLETVRAARAAGLRVCSGGIFGIGESWTQRIELAETLRELDVHSIPINFLTPVPGTAMADRAPPPAREALAVIAIFRLMHPGRDIVVCGGRTGALGRYDALVYSAGANGIMIGDYLTTRGGPLDRDRELLDMLGIG